MAQVSNVQSRTLRVLGSLSDDVKNQLTALDGCVVLEKVSNNSPKSFVTAPDVTKVLEVLSTNNLLFRPHFYSLFVKFNTELKVSEVDKLNAKVLALVSSANVSYSRVDENGHTGKVVVDRFEDYNTLRASTGDVTFYKFNRTKAQARVNTDGVNDNTNKDGWKTVEGTSRAPRTPRTFEGNSSRPPRAPRTDGGNSSAPRTPRTFDGNSSRPPRAPRAEGGNSSAPRAPRTFDGNSSRPPRAPRADGGNRSSSSQGEQRSETRTSRPGSWAGRTAATAPAKAASSDAAVTKP